MKLVRRLAMVVVLVALSIGALPALRGTETSAQVSVPHPCQVPAGFNEPVEIHTATASTTPRLVSSREVKQLTSQSPPPRAGISIEWAYTGWTTDDGNQNEVLFSGMWALPRTGALTFGGGRGAIVTVNEGDLVLLVCGANGEIDTTEHDNQSTALTAGSSTPIQAGTSFYVFLDGGPATYWLFGNRQGTPPEALVTIEIIGNNGGPSVCGITNCWPAPVLSAKPIASDCDGNTCKVINEPGGCGRIYCWTK